MPGRGVSWAAVAELRSTSGATGVAACVAGWDFGWVAVGRGLGAGEGRRYQQGAKGDCGQGHERSLHFISSIKEPVGPKQFGRLPPSIIKARAGALRVNRSSQPRSYAGRSRPATPGRCIPSAFRHPGHERPTPASSGLQGTGRISSGDSAMLRGGSHTEAAARERPLQSGRRAEAPRAARRRARPRASVGGPAPGRSGRGRRRRSARPARGPRDRAKFRLPSGPPVAECARAPRTSPASPDSQAHPRRCITESPRSMRGKNSLLSTAFTVTRTPISPSWRSSSRRITTSFT